MFYMEQINYIPKEMVIFGELLKGDSHIREISRKLKVNHMSIKRIMDKLFERNILDFRTDGKNKIFFLKENLGTRNLRIIYEVYKKIEIVRKYPLLRTIFEKIEKNKNIKMALLFGSYAKERSHSKSDIDIYLETKSLKLKKEIEMINSKISVKIGKFNKENLLIKEIIDNHVIIKGFEKYYEKTN